MVSPFNANRKGDGLTTPFALLIWPDPIGRVGKIPLPSGKKCVFGTETRCQIALFAHKISRNAEIRKKYPYLSQKIPLFALKIGVQSESASCEFC